MRLHPDFGARILGPIERLEDVCEIVRHCHEHWDGGGYPGGLAGEETRSSRASSSSATPTPR